MGVIEKKKTTEIIFIQCQNVVKCDSEELAFTVSLLSLHVPTINPLTQRKQEV